MEKNTKVIIFLAVAAVAVVALLAIGVNVGKSSGVSSSFAQCLTDQGVKMFGAYWCPHCAEQKRIFGSSFGKISYVECSLPEMAGTTQACIDAGIESYPTWEFGDDSRISGVLSLEFLSQKTGCSLEGK